VDLGIRDRVALVTAGSKGLGLASALALADEGCHMVICARRAGPLEEARRQIVDRGAEVLAIEADAVGPTAAVDLVAAAVDHFGAMDILVANTGGPTHVPPLAAESIFRDAVEAHLFGLSRLVRESVPHMREGGWGRICLITASGIREPRNGMAESAMARAGLWGWAKALSHELVTDNVTINTVCPGAHHTDRFRSGGSTETLVGNADDFGRVVAFLCSEHARWVNGVALNVDGGRSEALL
jgi:3-oxoacyl-[acyl-carrier protein] reductase